MSRSDKAKTNAKWTSTESYRDAWERIFGAPVPEEKKEERREETSTESESGEKEDRELGKT